MSVDFAVKFQEIDIRFKTPQHFTWGTTMVKSRLSPLNLRCLWLECRWLRRNSEACMKIIFNEIYWFNIFNLSYSNLYRTLCNLIFYLMEIVLFRWIASFWSYIEGTDKKLEFQEQTLHLWYGSNLLSLGHKYGVKTLPLAIMHRSRIEKLWNLHYKVNDK